MGPKAFGLISIVMVFVGFCELVIGDAVSEALISIRRIDDSYFATMNTVNVAISLAFGACVYFGASLASGWFGDPELVAIFRCMSVLPVISALAAVPVAVTKREMRFQPLALRSIVSVFIGGMVGLSMTLTGFGVWALVWQAIVTRIIASLVLWYAVPLRLRLGFSSAAWRELLKYGMPVLVSRTMGWSTGQFPRLIFGLYWGPTTLGLFSLGARLYDIVLEVALVPRYAAARVELRQFADDRAGLRTAMQSLLANTSVIFFPLCVGGAAAVPALFHAWLDARWYGGIVPAQLLLLMCVPFVTHYCAGAALLAMNCQRPEALNSTAQMLITVAMVMGFAPFGLIPATAALAVRLLLLLPLPAALLKRYCGVPPGLLWSAQRPALLAAVFMGIVVTLLRLALQAHLSSLALLPLLIAAGAATYTALIALLMPSVACRFSPW